jgi:hypothetical protein
MSTITVDRYELGPEQRIEAKLSAKFADVSPSRRPSKPELLAYWLGQIVGWPGHEFFSATRRLVDQESYVAALINQIAETAHELVRVAGREDSAGGLWALLCNRLAADRAASGEAYLKQFDTLLPWLAKPPRFHLVGQPRKTGRPDRDLFAMVPIRVVCAYLIHVEGYAPPVRHFSKGRVDAVDDIDPNASIAIGSKQRAAFPRQRAADIAFSVLGALEVNTVAEVESLIRHVLAEPWSTTSDEFNWWSLLPDVSPSE